MPEVDVFTQFLETMATTGNNASSLITTEPRSVAVLVEGKVGVRERVRERPRGRGVWSRGVWPCWWRERRV